MELLEIKALSLHFGGITALSDLEMTVKGRAYSCSNRSERCGKDFFVQLY